MHALLAIGLVGVAIAAIWVLWHRMLQWSHKSLIPWIRSKDLPRLAQIAEDAFLQLDRGISAGSYLAKRAWEAWRKFRLLLLKSTISFQRDENNQIIRRIENWIAEPTDTSILSHEVQEAEVSWEELPSDVRIAMFKRNQEYTLDLTIARDQEFMEMGLEN